MSAPRRPARYANSLSNPVTAILDQSRPLSFLTLHPALKFHGFRDIEWLAAREDRLARKGRDPSGGLARADVTGKTNNNLTNDWTRCDIRGKKITDGGAERSHCPREGLRPGRRSPSAEESGPGEAAWKDN